MYFPLLPCRLECSQCERPLFPSLERRLIEPSVGGWVDGWGKWATKKRGTPSFLFLLSAQEHSSLGTPRLEEHSFVLFVGSVLQTQRRGLSSPYSERDSLLPYRYAVVGTTVPTTLVDSLSKTIIWETAAVVSRQWRILLTYVLMYE